MRLTITHDVELRTAQPIRSAVFSLRLQPGDFDGQRIVEWTIDGGEEAKLAEPFANGSGDRIRSLTLAGPVEAVKIQARGIVETRDLAGVVKGWRERARPSVFLRETKATRPDAAIRALAEAAAEPASSALDVAHRLKAALRERLIHEEGLPEEPELTAAEALGAGRGTLRDFAHVLISAARARGLPARHVLGYRREEEEAETAALHSWAEVFVEGIGWIGFDAANDLSPTDAYVRLCSGLDAADADPFRYAYKGGEGAPVVTTRLQVRREEGSGPSAPLRGQGQFQGIGGQSQKQG
ncbi:transglutaminase family protein [Neomegalonema sp.]|uniref:transglutaminase-like domain-containing protein n=1 Tax=Neomegalonema sp. TaxID=2039713 RepID=UPI00262CAEE4|nr:transglutaminase family protein [Neomegalonema sp.]MDD2869370.1 transglutaminase family protein [Neomegalonema sp.]